MQGEYLTVREVEEYFFCPMLFYYRNSLGMEAPKELWAELGREVQEELSSFVKSNFRIVGREVGLKSERLRVIGKVDFVVEEGGKIAPLEVKYSKRVKKWWRYSLVLYAMLLEDLVKKPVKRAFLLLLGPRLVGIEVRDSDRNFVLRAVEKCRRIIQGEVPRPMPSRSCENCDFRRMCFES